MMTLCVGCYYVICSTPRWRWYLLYFNYSFCSRWSLSEKFIKKKKIMVVVGQSRLGRSNIVVLVACIIIIVTVVFCWEHILLVPVVETHDTYSVDKLCCDLLYCTKWNKLKKNLICPKQTGFHFNLLNSIVLIKLS